jgi:hypothetical protein
MNPHRPRRVRFPCRPLNLQTLEERCLLSGYTITDLGIVPGCDFRLGRCPPRRSICLGAWTKVHPQHGHGALVSTTSVPPLPT